MNLTWIDTQLNLARDRLNEAWRRQAKSQPKSKAKSDALLEANYWNGRVSALEDVKKAVLA